MDETGVYTIEEYLKGCIGLDVTDEMLKAALYKAGVEPGSPVDGLDERGKDLAEAWVLYACMTLPSVKGSVEDADGNWKHKEGQTEIYVTDKNAMRQRMNALFAKWGIAKQGGTKVEVRTSGIQRVWRR